MGTEGGTSDVAYWLGFNAASLHESSRTLHHARMHVCHTLPCRASAEDPVEAESAVKRTVSQDMHEQLLTIPSWRGFNNPWMAEDDQDVEFSYINLVDNPERYTGYKV